MKKQFYLSRSRFLLLTLFALLTGGASPVWADTLTENFDEVTLVDASGNAVSSYSYGAGLSNGWKMSAANAIYSYKSSTYYGLASGGNTGNALWADYSNSNTVSVIIPTMLTGEIKFKAVKSSSSTSYAAIKIYEVSVADGSFTVTSTQLGSTVNPTTTTWDDYSINIGAEGKYIAINMVRSGLDDFEGTIYVETYKKPATLTFTEISAETAMANWTAGSSDGSETGWDLEYKASSSDTWTEVHGIAASTTSYSFTSLTPNTSYDVRVKAIYDSEESGWKTGTFKTEKVATVADGFTDDFETDKGWELINGTVPNKWVRGTGTNNGGNYSIYISNDGSSYPTGSYGGSSLVYAAKLFSFEAGDYTIAYDWMCYGEGAYDFMRVGLVPSSVELTASTSYSNIGSGSTLPTGWTMFLDEGSSLKGSTAWATKAVNFTIETAGNYQIVFAWRNDGSGGSSPAAIDNFSITKQALSTPTGLAYSNLAATSVDLSWTANSAETEWQVKYGAAGFDVETEGTAVVATANSYTLSGLTPEAAYDVYVRAKSDENYSGWSTKVSFTTPELYPKPTDLTSSNVAATTATISWTKNGTETAWEYSCSTESAVPAEDGTYTSADATSVNLTGLIECTTYYVYVRAIVGGEHSAWSAVHSFTTTQNVVDLTTGSFTDDFESANNWVFVNGTLTNAWAWGSATNNGSEKSMYISKDGGSSNSYGTGAAIVFATKLFTLAQGKYDISYDWIANGESAYDYLRVAIAPASTALTAGTTPSGLTASKVPTGWIAIDGGSKLNQSTKWATKEVETEIPEAGNYIVVFTWVNDYSGGTNPPAAIDNFSIAFQACPKPTGVASSDVKGNKATLTWDSADDTSWEVYISTESAKPADNQEATAAPTTNTYEFTGLTAETTYYAWVRAVKDDAKSDWVGISFTTDVQYAAPTDLAIARLGTTATLTWTAGDNETAWEVVSSDDSAAKPDELSATEVSAATTTLESLTVGSTYYVWVRAKYGSGTDEHSAWVSGTFSLTYTAANPGSVDGDGITNVTFGTASEVVNYNTSKSPTYQDNSAQIGGVTAGLTANVDITYSTGYTYGTVIWVDWNKNYEFEESEVVYKGTSESSKPTTLNASFSVASTQAPGNYRMRIAGGDSYYDSFVGGGAYAETYPYTTSNYCIVHDYTLKVNEAADYSLAISGADISENTIAFGTVKNTTTTKKFTITNDGAGNLEGISVESSNPNAFTVSETGFNLASGESKEITVTFIANEEEDYEGTITVSHTNVATSIELEVTATYVTPTPATIAISEGATAVGASVAFGTVGKAKSKTFTVTNTGEATLNITSIVSSNTTDFTVSPATLDVNGGETGEFTVTFVWDGEALEAEKTANITVTPSNDGLSPVVFAVNGTRANLWMVDFEGENPLEGWENSGFTVKATAGSSDNVALTSKFAVSAYSGTSTLITPLLRATAGDKLTFDAFFLWGNDPMTVKYSVDGTDFDADGHTLYNFTGSPAYSAQSYDNIEITAPITGDFYLQFSTVYTNAIDNIEGFKLAPAREHDAVIADSYISSVGNQYKEYSARVTVKEKAGKADEVVTAELWIGTEKVATESGVTLTANDNTVITLKFTPEEAMSADAYIKVYNDNLNLTSETQTVTIYAATVLDETVGEVATGNQASMVVKYTAKNGWNTICMPFALTDDILTQIFGEGYKIYQFKGYSSDGEIISFQTASSFSARKPYLVYVATAASNPDGVKLFNVRIESSTPSETVSSPVTFQGTYAPVAAGSLTDWYGVTTDGEIRKAGSGASLKGFRAYFTGVPSTATARIAIEDSTTGITTILSQKEMEQGVYNLNGQKMQKTRKGLNIINGKKTIMK